MKQKSIFKSLFNSIIISSVVIVSLIITLAFISPFPPNTYQLVSTEIAEKADTVKPRVINVGFTLDGARLFRVNCASCHNMNMISNSTGPALRGVTDRWESQELLYAYIRNSQQVIASGNEYAVELWKKYNQAVMTSFPDLSDEEIDSLLDYIEGRTSR